MFIFKCICVFWLYTVVILDRPSCCTAWDNDELEIFDAVEEIGQNFYEVIGVTHDAELSEIKKAYRTLSKQLHPDKNDAPDADVKFRQLVSIYDTLRDEAKRAIYNRVLVEGLPDWRSPIFYFRRARKMSMFEISIILTVVISITQYLMAWGSFIDKKYTMEERLQRIRVSKDKKKKKTDENDMMEEVLEAIPRPSMWNILPFQLVKLVIFLFTDGPTLVKEYVQFLNQVKQEKEEERLLIEEEAQLIKEMDERRKEKKAQKKERKRVNVIPDKTGMDDSDNNTNAQSNGISIRDIQPSIPVITGGPWTEEDFSELSRLMAKYPGGTIGRWDIIAEQMKRTVYEVTKMSNKVKAQLSRQAAAQDISDTVIEKVKVKTKASKEGEKIDLSLGHDDKWPVVPQKALEKSLKMFPKGVDQRWDKIARSVPDKSKEECMIRFKYLAEKIRKKKEESLQIDNIETMKEEEMPSTKNSLITTSDSILINGDQEQD